MSHGPFWESAYRDPRADAFGPPSAEIVRLAAALPRPSKVLDAGCGEGRNALCLARAGHEVDAFDVSVASVEKLRAAAGKEGLRIHAYVEDVRRMDVRGPYDLVVSHGMLHLVERSAWTVALSRFRELTRPGGANVVCVFTDRVPCPADLLPYTPGLFREGELLRSYEGWRVEECLSYVFLDEHPGGVRHTHAADKVVAWKP